MKNHKTNKAKILITIAGPTAVGKTELTIKLAKKYDAHIFSADSRQLYNELNIGTAKPSFEDLSAVKHYFINHLSIQEEYNAGKYETDIDQLFEDYFDNRDVGLMTGGTGMYIQAALEGLDHFPEVDQKIKNHFERQLQASGIEYLQSELKAKDPVYYENVDPLNTRRLIRALSVIEASGRTYSSFLGQKKQKQHRFHVIPICLTRDRKELYDRIDERVDQMMQEGLLEEVRGLMPWQNLKSLETVGYRELIQHLNGDLGLEEAVELIKRNSRRYAKRQMTWFRNQGTWNYMDAKDVDSIVAFIEFKIREINGN